MSFPIIGLAYALTEFVPIVAKWLGGEDAESTAKRVVETAKTITGEKESFSILKALKDDPTMVIHFQEAILKMHHEVELEMERDRQNARVRDIAFLQSGRINLRADIMVVAAALGLIACLLSITFYKQTLPGEAVGIISTIAGIFGACLKDAYAFEFGSSRGSKIKDSKLAALMMTGQS